MIISRILKVLFFALLIKPIVFIVLGLNVRFREKLPLKGPAILAPNHNSHLDTMVLLSLYPLSVIHKVRPVAAADYFLANRLVAWFSLNVIGIIPLDRSGKTQREQLFSACHAALNKGDILILFPEGSRGQPEQMSDIKKGLYYVLKEHDETHVTPIIMHGLGRALPRGEALLVPFNCDVIIGEPIKLANSASEMKEELLPIYQQLYHYCLTRNVEQ
jgi:1-acyl-sn-glycerol-3-phosphate acyltransferase